MGEMQTYKCWDAEESDFESTVRRIKASCHEEAATLWAEAENREHNDYIADMGGAEVMVEGPGGLARVEVEAVVKYDFNAEDLQWIKKEECSRGGRCEDT